MTERIFFPVDLSLSCAAMATHVRRATDLFGARVTLVHVSDLASHTHSSSMCDLLWRSPKSTGALPGTNSICSSSLSFRRLSIQEYFTRGGAAAQIVEVAMAQPITPRPMEHRIFVCAMSNPLHPSKVP
jgi:hypothetical protein